MSLTSGMNLEASATGKDIAEVQRAPLTRRLMTAPIGLIVAEVGAQVGVFVEDQLASFLAAKDKKGNRDENWRGKVLVGKVLLAVMLYPLSVPLALGFAASGGLLHLLLSFPTFAESEDQARKRQRQLIKLGEKPRGRFTQKLKSSDKDEDKEDEDSDDQSSTEADRDAKEERAEADEKDIDLAAKLTDPDVLSTYGRAADLAWERLIRDGHLPPGTKAVINEAMVQEVQNLVRDAQKRGAV